MINLKNYIIEGIFDTDEDTIDKSIKDQIKQFLKDNFKGASSYKISHEPNNDGKYEVSSTGNVEVSGDVNGDVDTTGNINCYGDINGNIDSTGNVSLKRK